jgi:hypothetical protein
VLLAPDAHTQHSIIPPPFLALWCALVILLTLVNKFLLVESCNFLVCFRFKSFKQFQSGCTLIKTSLPHQLLSCPTNMTSKFVEHLDNSLVSSSHDTKVETSGRERAFSDSSAGTGSPDSRSPPEERVYRDRFPSPTRQSMESPTESPTRRRLRKLTLKKDAS